MMRLEGPGVPERSSFEPGETIVRRDMWFGRAWTVGPARVIEDDGCTLVSVIWPGVDVLAPTTWIAWLQGAAQSVREEALPRLLSRSWQLGRWTWRDNVYLTWRQSERWFDVTSVFRYLDHEFLCWKVDFGRPYRRVTDGIESRDLFVDLLVQRDGTAEWKDEGEYETARRLGLVSPEEHERIAEARQQVEDMLANRSGPFDEQWTRWRVDPAWSLPAADLREG